METIRTVATLLLLGPLAVFLGSVAATVRAFNVTDLRNPAAAQQMVAGLFDRLAYASLLAALSFVLGVVIHAVVAYRTGVYRKSIWWLIVAMSIFVCRLCPLASIPGLFVIILLVPRTFRKMRSPREALSIDGDSALKG